MKIFTHRKFTHKKIIVIFLLAIFLPLLIICYLSLSTFSKRRETVKKFLESNLWISGETALKSIEGTLLDHEQKALKSENFIRLIQSKESDHGDFSPSIFSEDTSEQFFLLDSDRKIVSPETASENVLGIQFETKMQNSQFAQLFQKAEFFEFSQKDYKRAAELYKECASSSASKQFIANALEGLGRCFLSSEKYDEADKVFNELSGKYSQIQNKAGHPYGIIAMFQISGIAREKKNEESYLGILLNLYKKIREGIWLIDESVYDFYIAEIESILNIEEGKFPEIQKSYSDIQKQHFNYKEALIFANFLEKEIIPKMKWKLSQYQSAGETVPERLLIPSAKNFSLVSYATLPNFKSEETFYARLLLGP